MYCCARLVRRCTVSGFSAAYFDVPLDMHAVSQALEGEFHTCASVKSRVRLMVSRDGQDDRDVTAPSVRSEHLLKSTLRKV